MLLSMHCFICTKSLTNGEIAAVEVEDSRIKWAFEIVDNLDAVQGFLVDDQVDNTIDDEVRPIGDATVIWPQQLRKLDVDLVTQSLDLVGAAKMPAIVCCGANDSINFIDVIFDRVWDAFQTMSSHLVIQDFEKNAVPIKLNV